MSQIVFARLDPLLVEPQGGDVDLVKAAIFRLQSRNIPLIIVTGKTRAEVVAWQRQFGLNSPFIVERGSGVFLAQAERRFTSSETETNDNYYLHQLGCSYTEARAALKAVQEEINKILRGFGDLDEENIQTLISSSQLAARNAKAREFSEYFITPNRLEIEQLEEVARAYGFKIVPGDKLSLILSAAANEVAAMEWLIQRHTDKNTRTVALGSTMDDLNLLETVDLPIIIPTEAIPSCLSDRSWKTASNLGIKGWAESLESI